MNANTTDNDRPLRDNATIMRDNIMAGLIAGIAGAVAVALSSMIYATVATPEEGWLPMKMVAATWLGVGALIGGNATVALGLATHFGTSMGWAIVLALLLGRRRNPVLTLIAGFLWGAVVVYLLMTWVVLPFLDPVMSVRVAVQPAWWWWVIHVIYGVTVGVFLILCTGMRRRRL